MTAIFVPAMMLGMDEGEREALRRWMRAGVKKWGSARKWADEAGTTPSNVTRFLSQDDASLPKPETLHKLERAAGIPLPFGNAENLTNKPLLASGERNTVGDGVEALPIDELDVRAGAGAGQLIDAPRKIMQWRLSRDLLRYATNAAAESIVIVTVVGDSMASLFNPFDKVLVDTTDITPSPPGVFVVFDGLGLVVKRVYHIPDTDPIRVRIESDNPKYPSYERVLGEAYIQGRVLGKWMWV